MSTKAIQHEDENDKIEAKLSADAVKAKLPDGKYDIFGLVFDVKSGKFEDRVSGKPVSDFTFESGETTLGEAIFPVNPTQFATEETRDAVLAIVLPELLKSGSVTDYSKHDTKLHQPAYRPLVERGIEFFKGEKAVLVNAGLLANSIIRSGEAVTLAGLKDTLNLD